MEIKHKIWLERNGEVIFGQGRESLLRSIDEHKSLSTAAKKLHMSYRAAWGKIRASEKRLGIKLLEHHAGHPLHLTKEARLLIEEYSKLEQTINAVIELVSRRFKLTASNTLRFDDSKSNPPKLTSIGTANLLLPLLSFAEYLLI